MSPELKPDGVRNQGGNHAARTGGQRMQTASADECPGCEQQWKRWQRNSALLCQHPKEQQSIAVPLNKRESRMDIEMVRHRSTPRREFYHIAANRKYRFCVICARYQRGSGKTSIFG